MVTPECQESSKVSRSATPSADPSEGFPRLAYLGPGAGWDGGWEDFEDSRSSGITIRAQGPKLLGEKIQKTSRGGPGPVPRVLGPGPMGPRSGKLKITKRTSALEKNPRTFRMARIDPSRQGVMTEPIFVHGKI